MSNNMKTPNHKLEALSLLLHEFSSTQDVKLIQQGLMQSMRLAVAQAYEQDEKNIVTNIVDATLEACNLLDILFRDNQKDYSPFASPYISYSDLELLRESLQYATTQQNIAESQKNNTDKEKKEQSKAPKPTYYRNTTEVVAQQDVSVDQGALWQLHANVLVLVDEDEYLTHVLDHNFVPVADID